MTLAEKVHCSVTFSILKNLCSHEQQIIAHSFSWSVNNLSSELQPTKPRTQTRLCGKTDKMFQHETHPAGCEDFGLHPDISEGQLCRLQITERWQIWRHSMPPFVKGIGICVANLWAWHGLHISPEGNIILNSRLIWSFLKYTFMS